MEIERLNINELIADPANVRRHPEKNMAAIKGSLARFGQTKPIVVNHNNIVIAGNGTLEAARALGWEEIDIVRTDMVGSEAIAYAIADNRTAELALWDDESLGMQLTALKGDGIDLEDLGWTNSDILELGLDSWNSDLNEIDKVKETDKPTEAKIVIVCSHEEKDELKKIISEVLGDFPNARFS